MMNAKFAWIIGGMMGAMVLSSGVQSQEPYSYPAGPSDYETPEQLPPPSDAPPPLPVSQDQAYEYFYRPLSPYGDWINIPGYGMCWRPARVSSEWRPYLRGHWVWTDCGWTWASDEPWAWSCYHYGRWLLTTEMGWVWVPDVTWAPAWVCWSRAPDFVCWAPLPPRAPVGVAFAGDALFLAVGCWTAVAFHDFLARDCERVAWRRDRCERELPRARTVINVRQENRFIVNVGPGRDPIARATGRPVPMLKLQSVETRDPRPTTRVEANRIVVATPSPALRQRAPDPSHVRHVEKVTPARAAAPTAPSAVTPQAPTPTGRSTPYNYQQRTPTPPQTAPRRTESPTRQQATPGTTQPVTPPPTVTQPTSPQTAPRPRVESPARREATPSAPRVTQPSSPQPTATQPSRETPARRQESTPVPTPTGRDRPYNYDTRPQPPPPVPAPAYRPRAASPPSGQNTTVQPRSYERVTPPQPEPR